MRGGQSRQNLRPKSRRPAVAIDRNRLRPSVRTSASGAIPLIAACNSARFSWIEAITGPIGTPTSTNTASDSWRLASIVSGTASEAPMR
jgi:hypothetical protein